MIGTFATYLHLGERPFETEESQTSHISTSQEWNRRSAFHNFLWSCLAELPEERTPYNAHQSHPCYNWPEDGTLPCGLTPDFPGQSQPPPPPPRPKPSVERLERELVQHLVDFSSY